MTSGPSQFHGEAQSGKLSGNISYRAAAVTEGRLPQARVSFKARTPPRGSVSVSSTG